VPHAVFEPQSAATLQPHWPAKHLKAMPAPQAVMSGLFANFGTPATHEPVWQSLPSVGVSLLLGALPITPPEQVGFWQSFGFVSGGTSVSSLINVDMPATHTGFLQSPAIMSVNGVMSATFMCTH